MSRIPPIALFLSLIITVMGLAFTVHINVLHHFGHPGYPDRIVLSYFVNGALAIVIYIALFSFRLRLKNHIGFLYMFGSLLKFAFFFILFYPFYKEDGEMHRLEFAAFFIPYAISLIFETVFTAKMLQKLD
tara:strand:- start:3474 stop:3866 length:393 start_codon:yes stop_codon:yes gene_type:complete